MSRKPVDIEHWSRIASEWTAWARASDHDAFWAYRASLISFIGHGTGDTLDVGCGEGRVSRVLKECGCRVMAIDPVEKLISAAEQAGSADYYRIAAAADLPFENCSFDLAVAYNVLMGVEDVPGALSRGRGPVAGLVTRFRGHLAHHLRAHSRTCRRARSPWRP
jgi:2-polyprenyl-3-methyl-5-hydroxy-6-metoxy-1,4-benzoquinol methylase